MSNLSAYEQLDADINALLAGYSPETGDGRNDELLAVANELRMMPDPAFKARLRAEIEHSAVTASERRNSADSVRVMPTLFGQSSELYPVHRASFAASVGLHAAAMVLIIFSSAWLMQNRQEVKGNVITMLTGPDSSLPVSPTLTNGGGGGGDQSKLDASRGQPPKFAREQITPPMAVVRNESPKLPVVPTVVGPSTITFPTSVLGDPLSNVSVASSGTGMDGGIGSGRGGGVGGGNGAGVGPGYGGGIGGGVYRVGGGVSAPRALFDPDPDYSEEARKARHQGVVILNLIVDANGKPRDIKIARSLGMGLDEKAIQSVMRWRFQPAMKDGRAVPVQINVEVNFHLY